MFIRVSLWKGWALKPEKEAGETERKNFCELEVLRTAPETQKEKRSWESAACVGIVTKVNGKRKWRDKRGGEGRWGTWGRGKLGGEKGEEFEEVAKQLH